MFTVHAGEYLTGLQIEKRFRKFHVWVPAKDTGVDLLVTNPAKQKQVGLQVKFSKDFLSPDNAPTFHKGLRACGWWTLNRDKIKKSMADFWVFVLYSFDDRNVQFLIIPPAMLLRTLKRIHGNTKTFNVYFWVTSKNKCWEARDLNRSDQSLIAVHQYSNPSRDVTRFLNDWSTLKRRLS